MASGIPAGASVGMLAVPVSILVLVKYGLGVGGGPRERREARDVSILVLVKYGLGDRGHGRHEVRHRDVSILVLVKYGLGGASRASAARRAPCLNSCSGEVWPRGL